MMKASDSETGEILAVAQWNQYVNGFADKGLDLDGLLRICPKCVEINKYTAIASEVAAKRKEFVTGGPTRLLTNLSTRVPYRRRGAGSALVRWGLVQAAEDGALAYLESAPNEALIGWYERHGFQRMGPFTVTVGEREEVTPMMT